MAPKPKLKMFEHKQVRSVWDENQEKWYFSAEDVIAILTDSDAPGNYWKVLKYRLGKEGSQLVTKCNQLKLASSDEKFLQDRRCRD